jgi:hypothetical protein
MNEIFVNFGAENIMLIIILKLLDFLSLQNFP